MGGTTAWDSDASPLNGAPAEARIADASAGLTVVVVRTIRGDIVALIVECTPGSSEYERSASSAAVGGGATVRNGNAGKRSGAPALAGRADALSGDAVVIGRNGTGDWEIVAGVGSSAPASVSSESSALSAVVMGGAA